VSSYKHLKISISLLFILIIIGIFGYKLIEKWKLLDSIYMTIITITTVGYGEIHSLSTNGKIFTIIFILSGVIILAYAIGSLSELIIEDEIRKIFGRRKLEKKIAKLKNHYIICGYGRMGKVICDELDEESVPFIVIEKDENVIDLIDSKNFLYIKGDATLDEILIKAEIKRAKGLVAVTSSDAENLYITLTAKNINPRLKVIARTIEDGADVKLKMAGADMVFSLYQIGGMKMAQAILRPAVLNFIEIITQRKSMELLIEEVTVNNSSPLAGKTLRNSGIRQELGVIIIAIKKNSGEMLFNPIPDTLIEANDKLLALGEKKNLKKLERIT
jgi:voltage-gated potassium channel